MLGNNYQIIVAKNKNIFYPNYQPTLFFNLNAYLFLSSNTALHLRENLEKYSPLITENKINTLT